MKKMILFSSRLLLAFSVIGFSISINRARGATLSWSGGGAANANWNNSANWGFAGIPASGDTLVFPAGQPNLLNTNNIAGLVLNQIRFAGAGGGYDIRGNAITMTNSVQATNTTGLNTIEFDIALSTTTITVNVGSGASLTLSGVLSGSVGLTKAGSGLLALNGPFSNTYGGITTINAGTVTIQKVGFPAATAIPGDVIVGDGVTAATLRNLDVLEIADGANVTIKDSSTWDLNGNDEAVNSLTLSGGTVSSGAGTTILNGDVTVIGSAVTATISGNLRFNGGLKTITVPNGSVFYDLIINANIADAGGGLLFTNSTPVSNFIRLLGSNSFTGPVTIQNVTVAAETPTALGSASSGTTVLNNGWLWTFSTAITNESLTLQGGSRWTAQSGLTWAGPVTLNGDATVQVYPAGSALDVIGTISGAGGFTKIDDGRMILSGASPNTYAGTTTVNGGILELHKTGGTAIPNGRPLVIGDGVGGADVDVVRQTIGGSQIIVGSVVTINSSGLYDLNGFSDDVGPFNFTGGHITTGAGVLTLSDNVTAAAATSGPAVIQGKLQLSSDWTFNMLSGPFSPSMVIPAAISGSGLIKTGPSDLELDASNSYSGLTIVATGQLVVGNSFALGATNVGTVVSNGAGLVISGNLNIGQESLNTVGPGATSLGALWSGNNYVASWAGPITLGGNTTIGVVGAAGQLTLSGAISGSGGLRKINNGTLIFSGSVSNTYSGATTVEQGTLVLNKTYPAVAVPGNLTINNGATTRLANNEQTSPASDVLVNTGGLFNFSTNYTYIDELSGAGNVNFGLEGWIWLGVNDGSSTFDGLFTGTGYAPGWTVGKTGSGNFTMNGNNTFTAGNINIQGSGQMLINGSQPLTPVLVSSVSTLGGTGSVGVVIASGNVAPGASLGVLSTSNLTFSSTGDYFVELTGPFPGIGGYDQINVRGTNNLANATLHVSANFVTPVGVSNQFTIINNDGIDAITGTFNGLPQGATINSGFYSFVISYTGGDGNDVVLILTNVPGAAVGALVSSGNSDGAIGPNECDYLSIVISNKTATAMTNISATLVSVTPNVAVTQPFATYSDASGNGTVTNVGLFQITTSSNLICGTDINLQLQVVSSPQGAFTVPLVIHSGSPGATPARYDNNIVTNVPDIGTIESTNNVPSWSGVPLAKVAVSLWLVAPFSSDMTLTLIAPDGTPVLLSSGNGAGANFGTGSADASRTTFDDAAPTSITAGASPFVGTFRPQASLAGLLAVNPIGNWRLRIQDSFGGGSPDTLRAWSLFLYGTECGPGSGVCELCPNATIYGDIGASSLVASDRLVRNGIASSCGAPTTCPGPFGGDSPFYDAFRFRNGPSNACITVALNAPTADLFSAAYLGSFSPTDTCSNYLADAGNSTSFSPTSQSYSFNVPSGAEFVVEVNSVFGSTGTYQLTVSGGDCRPVLNITPISGSQAVLDWTTAAPGYKLEQTNNLTAGTVWPPVPGEPVIINSRFTITNSVGPSNQFFRLRKPLP